MIDKKQCKVKFITEVLYTYLPNTIFHITNPMFVVYSTLFHSFHYTKVKV